MPKKAKQKNKKQNLTLYVPGLTGVIIHFICRNELSEDFKTYESIQIIYTYRSQITKLH